MTLNIGQLLEDAKRVRHTLVMYGDLPHDFELGINLTPELEAIDRIIAYFEERYVPPSEPGSFRQARGVLAWNEGDEPAEDSIRRIRGG